MAGLVLGIETATALGGVAVVSGDGRILGEVTLLGRESHSERIVPAAAELLAALGASPADLVAVAVSRGPGSFTGLRTGVAAAKGLAFSRDIPLYGVSTLEALAAGAPEGSGAVCALLGARRGEVYRAVFDAGPGWPARRTPDELVAEHGFADGLPSDCLVLGEVPPGEAGRPARARLRFAPAHLNHPRAAVIAHAGRSALLAGRPSELAGILPVYLRPAADALPAAGGAKDCQTMTRGSTTAPVDTPRPDALQCGMGKKEVRHRC